MERFKRCKKPCRCFYSDNDGNAMIFVVLVLFTMVCFFVFTIHVGQRFTNKIEMQNAADAAAISGAVWKARGFNLISILNVSMSECLALIIMFMAFDSTVEYTKIALPINKMMADSCYYCRAWSECLRIQKIFLDSVLVNLNQAMKKLWESPKILWELMKALKTLSNTVSYMTNVMSYLDASTIARLNGADALFETSLDNTVFGGLIPHAVLWPYQANLPVKDGSFKTDLCHHTWHGGDGYDNYLCYDDALDLDIGGIEVDLFLEMIWFLGESCVVFPYPPLIEYELQKTRHYEELCATKGADKVQPLVLADDWEKQVKYTALVVKIENTVNSSYFLGSDGEPVTSLRSDMSGEMVTYGQDGNSEISAGHVNLPERTWALARAEVYNPGQKDLFNQNWHAKLIPVDINEVQPDFFGYRIPFFNEIFRFAGNNALNEVLAH